MKIYFYGYINILKSKIIIGFIHEAMWAGKVNNLGALPSTFEDFLNFYSFSWF